MLKKMKLQKRLLSAFTIILVFMLTISAFAIFSLQSSNDNFKYFIKHSYHADSSAKICRIQTNVAARALRDMLLDTNAENDAVYIQKYNNSIIQLNKSMETLKLSYVKNDGLVEKYETETNNWMVISNNILEQLKSGNDATAHDMLLNQCTPALDKIVVIATELDKSTNDSLTKQLNKNLSLVNKSVLLISILVLLSILISLLLAIQITRSIVKPINEIENAAIGLSKGNLKSEITYQSTDELGALSDSMRSSMDTLSLYINDISHTMSEMSNGNFNISTSNHFVGDFENIEISMNKCISSISSALKQIDVASQQVFVGSDQVSSGAQALSQGATEQASSIEELSSTIREISVNVDQNAQTALVAQKLSAEATSEMELGKQRMIEMIDAMKEISETSNQISKIIKTIEDIAFQTNILSLNASVEAARAGNAGKGFAVVADEVRNLAQKSADAAKNTTDLIQNSLSAVSNGSNIVEDTAKALDKVVNSEIKVAELVEKISTSSVEQSDSIRQITLGVEQISSVVQINAATAEESAATAEELSGQSSLLKELVQQFKL